MENKILSKYNFQKIVQIKNDEALREIIKKEIEEQQKQNGTRKEN